MGDSSRGDPGATRVVAVVLLGLLAAGAMASAVAAARYPGGTWMDRTTVGHSFWGNFLCDISRDPALDGLPHPAAPWGRAAEWSLVLALGLFFWIVPALVEPRRRGWTIRILGAVATLGLVLVPVTSGPAHALALVAGAGPGFAATVLVLRGLWHRPALAGLGVLSLGLSGIELGLFLGFSERFGALALPPAVPAVQRLALLASVAWMAACAVAVVWLGAESGAD